MKDIQNEEREGRGRRETGPPSPLYSTLSHSVRKRAELGEIPSLYMGRSRRKEREREGRGRGVKAADEGEGDDPSPNQSYHSSSLPSAYVILPLNIYSILSLPRDIISSPFENE